MDWILRSGTAALTLALAVACGRDETPAAGAASDTTVPAAIPPSSDEPVPQDVTRLVMQKKLDGQLQERERLRSAIADLEERKAGLTGGKYAADLDAQIEGLRAEMAELDRKILLTRATLQQLPE